MVLIGLAPSQSSLRTLWAVPAAIARTAQVAESTPIASADHADQLVQKGRDAYQEERFSEAAQVWQRALTIYEAQQDRLNQALLLSYLSLAEQKLGRWHQATAAITQSLKLGRSPTAENAVGRSRVLAQALNTQGSLQFAQGQTEAALATWEQAAELYAQAGDEAGRIGSLINQAQAQQALGLYLRARKTLVAVQQVIGQQPDLQIRTAGLRSLGNLLRLVGDLQASRQVLIQGLAEARQLASPSEISATLVSLGNTARSQHQTQLAIDYYQQAIVVAASPITVIQARLNQLSLLIETQQWSPAQSLASELSSQLTRLPAGRSAIEAEINWVQSLIRLQQNSVTHTPTWRQLAQVAANAVQQAQSLGDRRTESYALGTLGRVYEQTQAWSDAQKLTQQALLVALAVDAGDISYQWQWQLGRLLKAQGNPTGAIAAYREAFQTLQPLRRDLVAINPDIQFSFRERVEPVYRELVALLLQSPPSAEGELSQTNLQQAREVIEALRLVELDNFFRSACLDAQIVPLDRVEQTAVAVLYPIILPDRLEVILSLPQQPLRHYGISISGQEVEQTLKQLRLNLAKPYTATAGKHLSQTVYNWLIQPAAADLARNKIQTLVFVLDGGLRNVPMAALYDGQHYLVERYSVAVAPGLQLVAPHPLKREALKVLAGGLTEERHGFGALFNVKSELTKIQSTISTQVLLNQTFTSAALQQQINSRPFPIVHLATHGQFSSDASETFVLAWDKPINLNELSELLRSREQLNPAAIELLVLSACQTATGDQRAALGLAGVAVRAGARSTLASLWNLNDESAALLTSLFYQELVKGTLNKAEALRQAQLALLRDRDYRHPVHWAPYVLVGNWL